jgi:hypothetical protein
MEARSPGNADAAAIRQQLLPSQRPARESERKWGLAAAQSFSRVTFANRPSQTWADTSFAIFGNIGRTTALSVGDRHPF